MPNFNKKTMKEIVLLMMLFISLNNYSQFAVSPSGRGADEKFEDDRLEKFKKTTTIFVLSDQYSKEDYERILKEVWTVTPFKVINYKDFKVLDIVNGNYSFVKMFGNISISEKGTTYVNTSMTVKIMDVEKYKKSYKKLDPNSKKFVEKEDQIFYENLIDIARFPLSINNKFLSKIMKSSLSDENLAKFYNEMYTEKSFSNLNLGMLKNYFQQINKFIDKSEHCGLYDDFVSPELQKLQTSVLYIPETYKNEYDPYKITEKTLSEKEIDELLTAYKYKHQFISETDLEKRILNNEEIYYLRYVSMNANKYLQIVNGKTGEPLYYFYGIISYNLKDKDFKKIYKAIND